MPTCSQVATNLDKATSGVLDLDFVNESFKNLRDQWGGHRIGCWLFDVIENGGSSASEAESARIEAKLSAASGFPRDQYFGVRRRKLESEGKACGPKLQAEEETLTLCLDDLVDKLVDNRQATRAKYTNYSNQKVKTAEGKIAALVEKGDEKAAKQVRV